MRRQTQAPLLLPVLLLLLGTVANAEPAPLGRLFYTPEQRATLDRQRLQGRFGGDAASGPLTLNGRVTRSSGKNTAWVNGIPVDERETASLGGLPDKAGDTAAGTGAGDHKDLLNGGKIVIKRQATQP